MDAQGFAPIGQVTSGCDLLTKVCNANYRPKEPRYKTKLYALVQIHAEPDGASAPKQWEITSEGGSYLKKFPALSYVKKASFINAGTD